MLTPEGVGSGGVVGRWPRHMHKRSSSLNDQRTRGDRRDSGWQMVFLRRGMGLSSLYM